VRRLVVACLALALAAGAVLLWARLLRAGPTGPIPGGALRGELAAERPADWSFANREPYLLVESRAFALPWSGRVWFIAHAGRLHLLLPGFFGDGLKRRLDADPRLRVAIDGKLYEQVALPVTSDEKLAELLAPVLRRQFALEIAPSARRIGGGRAAEMWIYRLEDPPGD
jgi:hypothetical protein